VSSYKEHCDECKEKLGHDFSVVHRWLDAMAKNFWPFKCHRAVRHHKEGIEVVRKKWGNVAAQAAELHILADMEEERLERKILSAEEIEAHYGVKFTPNKKKNESI